MFLTALEALHRRLSIQGLLVPDATCILVSVGYPLPSDSSSVFHPRRRWDLTPPLPEGQEEGGGADELIDFLGDEVRKLAHRRLRETRSASRSCRDPDHAPPRPGREMLYGHSFGGLFTLHALFTRPAMFNCFVASSPSIWWHDRYILREEVAFREGRGDNDDDDDDDGKMKPSLILSVGGQEQVPPRYRGEPEDEYKERLRQHQERRMVDNVRDIHQRLEQSGKLGRLSCKVYEGEDHGTVIACSLSRGLTTFIEDWPFES